MKYPLSDKTANSVAIQLSSCTSPRSDCAQKLSCCSRNVGTCTHPTSHARSCAKNETSALHLARVGMVDRHAWSGTEWYHWSLTEACPSGLTSKLTPFHRVFSPIPSAISSMTPGNRSCLKSMPSSGSALGERPSALSSLASRRRMSSFSAAKVSMVSPSLDGPSFGTILPFTTTASRLHCRSSPRSMHGRQGTILSHLIFLREHSLQLSGIRWVWRNPRASA